MQLLEQEPLNRHTTLRTGGPARYFAVADTLAALRKALALAQEHKLPTFVLGGGSNVLAADGGYNGLVLKVANRGIEAGEPAGDTCEVTAAAGESWDALVAWTVKKGLAGLENLSLIPGSVGGAVAGNIGAYGAEIKDTLRWVEAMDQRTGEVRRFTLAECEFGYRRSFFKTPAGRPFIILRAAFALRPQGQANLSYRELREFLLVRHHRCPSAAIVREAVIVIRRSKLPDWEKLGTAGSFFKNPIIPRPVYEELSARCAGLPGYDEPGGQVKIPLAWILDKVCKLKGFCQGKVGVHELQALVIVNHGGTAADIAALAGHMARKVKESTGLAIEWEVEKLG